MIRSCLRSVVVRRIPASSFTLALSRSVSQDTGKSKIYELREYSLKPDGAPTFLKLMEQFKHLRLKYGNYFGYWNVEFGGLNRLIHIWEFDSFEHRAQTRAGLVQDEQWLEDFVRPAFPCLLSQNNSVLLAAEWCNPQPDKAKSGAFELTSYGMKIGGPKIWEEKLKSSVLAHARLGYTDLVGVWYTDVGDHNIVKVLWRYDSFDARREGRNKAHRDPVVVNKIRDNLGNVVDHSSVLMTALPFAE